MNEPVDEAQASILEGPSAGFLLRQAREQAGVHVEALAVVLKVPPLQIEALEADRHEFLPDIVFARALAASVCRNLKVDPQPILDRMPRGRRIPQAKGREPINEPFRAPGDASAGPWQQWLRKPAVLVALALLLGALTIMLLPVFRPVPVDTAGSAAPVLPPGAQVGEGGLIVTPIGANTSAAEGTSAASANPPAVLAAAAAPVPVAAVASANPATSAVTAPTTGAGEVIQIRAAKPSWVQVTDARGTALVKRTLAAGETAALPAGALPLSVVVGSADGVAVQVRGAPFDLSRLTRDNVARFEVK